MCLAVLSATGAKAQSSSLDFGSNLSLATANGAVSSAASSGAAAGEAGSGSKGGGVEVGPFSRLALGAGISIEGVNLEATTIVSRYFNVRATGDVFQYTDNNISTNGFNAAAKLNLGSARASLDIYPFPTHGLRFSPGVMFYNQNALSGTVTVAGGQNFTLNGMSFTSSNTNPVTGTVNLGLNTQKPAFSITTGWGNQISRKGGHLSFPVEVGVALIGSPSVNLALVSGQVCDGEGDCQNVATDTQVQTALQAQIAKYKHDLDPLKTFPILSFGVAYNFKIR
jgi:hypothetical protein